jgi:excisionase family DNA binding protein
MNRKEQSEMAVQCLTVDQAARALNVGRGKIYLLMAGGVLPRMKIGARTTRIPKPAIDAYVMQACHFDEGGV